jgi:glycosyltransferase involved in cell wall biosynthesis
MFLKKLPAGKLRVLHIISGLPIGGAERLIETICRRFDKDRFSLYVCSLTDEGMIGSEIRSAGTTLISLKSSIRVYNIRTIMKILHLIKGIKPDIVQTHIYPANTLGRISAFLAGVPCVIATEHGLYRHKKKRQLFLDRLLSHGTDKIVVISEAVKTYISTQSKIPGHKFQVIHNFIEPERFVPRGERSTVRREFGLSGEEFVVGSVGRMVAENGYDVLIEAMRKVTDGGHAISCVLVGGGKHLELLKFHARAAGLGKDILFPGFCSDVGRVLEAFDLYVLPTLDEGFGISVIEAMAAGLPVIATSVDAIPEVIQDGKNGLLVPANDPLALANRIEYLYRNVAVRDELSKEGKETVLQKFSAEVGVRKLEGLYLNLCSQSG